MRLLPLIVSLFICIPALAGLGTDDFTANIEAKITNKTGLPDSDFEFGYNWQCLRRYHLPHSDSLPPKKCGDEEEIIPVRNGVVSVKNIEGEMGNIPGHIQLFVRKKSDKKKIGIYSLPTTDGNFYEIKGDFVLVRIPEEKMTVKLSSGKNPKEMNPGTGFLKNFSANYYFTDVVSRNYIGYYQNLSRYVGLNANGDLVLAEQFMLLETEIYNKNRLTTLTLKTFANDNRTEQKFQNVDFLKLPASLKYLEINDIKK